MKNDEPVLIDGLVSPLMGRRDGLGSVILGSMIAHTLALGAAFYFQGRGPILDLNQKPITAKLVRLGEKRDPKLLPRMEPTPLPPPAPEPVPIPTAAPAAPVAPPKSPTTAPKPPPGAKTDPLAAALRKIKKDQIFHPATTDGDPSGDPGGDSSDASEGDRYLALVRKALTEVYRVPSTISETDRMHLKAIVVLFIESDGRVAKFTFEKRSGNGAFDSALERAIRQARLPPPPAEHRGAYRRQGLGVHFHI
jgi:colicin import membrane protein/protein TonB